jgi:hypothetical protein
MGNFAVSHRLFESDLPRRSDAMVYGANAGLAYTVSSQHRLGGGAAGTFQDFKASKDGAVAPSQAFFLNAYGTWTWTLNETTTFEVAGGPAFVKNNQDAPPPQISRPVVPYVTAQGGVSGFELSSCGEVNGVPVWEYCGVVRAAADAAEEAAIAGSGSHLLDVWVGGQPTGGSASSWTFFGTAALNKRWTPRLASSLVYRRTESTASGTGSATLDLVSLSTTWRISELWDAGLRADFTQRESTAPASQTFTVVGPATEPGVNPLFAETVGLTASIFDRVLDTSRWGVSARMTRRLTKHLYASLRYAYNEQTSKAATAGSTSDFSNNLVTLGVEYNFERWRLW